jgi:hypothetical protein
MVRPLWIENYAESCKYIYGTVYVYKWESTRFRECYEIIVRQISCTNKTNDDDKRTLNNPYRCI